MHLFLVPQLSMLVTSTWTHWDALVGPTNLEALQAHLVHTFPALSASQPYPQPTVTTNHIICPFNRLLSNCMSMLPSAPTADSKSHETWDWKAIRCLLPTHLGLPFPQYQREFMQVMPPVNLLLPTLHSQQFWRAIPGWNCHWVMRHQQLLLGPCTQPLTPLHQEQPSLCISFLFVCFWLHRQNWMHTIRQRMFSVLHINVSTCIFFLLLLQL